MISLQAELDWQACGPMLEKALSYDPMGSYRLEDVKAEVEQGLAHFWRWPQDPQEPPTACAVTNFVVYPRVKALSYWLIGGELADVRKMLPLVEDWGLMQGCSVFCGIGRRGFERAFASDGYRPAATVYVKKITRGLN